MTLSELVIKCRGRVEQGLVINPILGAYQCGSLCDTCLYAAAYCGAAPFGRLRLDVSWKQHCIGCAAGVSFLALLGRLGL